MRASVRLAVWLARRFIRRLAPLRGRRTRIIRRLRRQAELGFKFGDTRTKRGVLRLKTRHPDNNLVQPLDRLRLRQNKPDQCLTVQQLKRLLIHPSGTLTSAAATPVRSRTHSRAKVAKARSTSWLVLALRTWMTSPIARSRFHILSRWFRSSRHCPD